MATAPAMWPELDRADADRIVPSLAGALAAYGLDAQRRVAVVAAPTPEALVALCAAGLCGARAMLVDPGIPDATLVRVLADANVAFILAGGEATLRRVIDLRPELETVELVLALVEPSLEGRPLPALSVASLLDGDGPAPADVPADPGFEIVGPDATVRRWPAADLARRLGELAGALGMSPGDTALVRLPPTDPYWAPGVGAALSRQSGVVLDVPGGGDLERALAIHRPTIALLEAREVVACRVAWDAEAARRSWIYRKGYAWALEKGATPETGRWVRSLADRLVLAAYRGRTGGRVRKLLVHGGPIDPVTTRFFSAVGIAVEELRG